MFLYGGNIPSVVSLCFASQRSPTVCPHCAGSISTIGLRSFLLKVSGVRSLLIFCCTCLVSGLIIPAKGGFVYSQTPQRNRRSFSRYHQKTVKMPQNIPRSGREGFSDSWKKLRRATPPSVLSAGKSSTVICPEFSIWRGGFLEKCEKMPVGTYERRNHVI